LSQLTRPEQDDAPAGEENWLKIDANRGAETALVAVSETPLTRGQIDQVDKLTPYAGGNIRLDTVYHVASTELSHEISRGLGGVVSSRKDPLSPDFEKKLKDSFAVYHGMVIPHQ
ncbi:MAG TPA: hypothetical protein VGI75_14855, partial [Pirellulales bacterium]